MTKLKTILPKQNLLKLYHVLVHSNLTYGIAIRGSSSHLQKLQILQNKAVKALCNALYGNSAKPLYTKQSILQIQDIHKYEIVQLQQNINSNPIF